MAFDPTWPPHGAELESLPFRDQFNGLKALIDAQAAQIAALQAENMDLQSQADVLAGQLSSLESVAGSADAKANALDGRVSALEIQTPPSGALNVMSVTADGNISASTLSANGGLLTVGRFNFQVDGNGNLGLLDTITGWSTPLSNIPI